MTRLSPSAAYFEGHFPGRPILPGITQIALVADVLRRELGASALRAVRHARLRQLVAPGDALDLAVKSAVGGSVRFELRCGADAVTNGELELGEPPLTWHAEPSDVASMQDYPSMEHLLPHRPPMRFVQRVLTCEDEYIACEAAIPPDCALVDAGAAPAIAAVEAAAQAAAVWEALRRWNAGARDGAASVGYLVSLREVAFATAHVAAEQPFQVVVRLRSRMLPLSTYSVEAYADQRPLLRGEIGTFLAPGA